MAPASLVNTSHGIRDTNRCVPDATKKCWITNNDDVTKNIDVSKIDNKIDFFRFMGLEINRVSDYNANSNTNNNTNNNNPINSNGNTNQKMYDVEPSPERYCKPSSRISNCDIAADKFACRSSTKRQKKNRRSNSGDMVDSQNIIKLMKECRVMIIGEKCRFCGKSFKCIKDVQLHVRKKHRARRPRTRLVLRIGNEVISTVPIRRKHLKRVHRDYQARAILNNDETATNPWSMEISNEQRINDERLAAPSIDLDDIYIVDNNTSLTNITNGNVSLSPLGNTSVRSSSRRNNEEDEDIREVLRITRSAKLGPTINHETPNRTERELLLSDAIREFDRMDNDPMGIIEFVDNNDSPRYDNNDIIENGVWLGDGNSIDRHLDVEENNCTFHIHNDYDIDFSLVGVNSLAKELDTKYFDDENGSVRSEEYRRENGDIVPDFIDYAHSLDDNNPTINNNDNNNSNVHELESSFYNEARISEWNELSPLPKTINCDILKCSKRSVDPSVLIKEEIMLDDIL